jgi:outer membrane protein TolC
MRSILLTSICLSGAAVSAAAQTVAATPAIMQLTVDDAVRLALEHNPDLKADRLDPQISDTRVATAAGAFRPALATGVNRNNQLQPPYGFLVPAPTRTDAITSNAGINQRLPWFGTSYSVGWNAVHTESNSFLNAYNPLLQSGLSLGVSQPLVRDLSIDAARTQLATSRVNRDIADTRLRESIVHTTAATKSAYWNLVSARANVDARQKALDLARELARDNQARVDVGQAPPLDLVSAQAEVASNEEQLIVAETAVKQAEDRLRTLILDTTQADAWTVHLEASDSPPVGLPAPDLDQAISGALRERTDLVRARLDIRNSDTNVKYTASQRLPDVRLNASYQANGVGGTPILRSGGFPGNIIGSGPGIELGNVLNQLLANDYPTWYVGVNVSYPIGESVEEANHARARLVREQANERLKGAEARAILQIRDASWKIDMNAKRIGTARAARELAEQRLDAEQKRFEVGLSTNFLVIQAQRDLAQAKTNEVSAVLAYDQALVDFEEMQQAGPAGSAAPVAASTAPAVVAAAAPTTSPATTSAIPVVTGLPPVAAVVP